jgi:hypothetical protein
MERAKRLAAALLLASAMLQNPVAKSGDLSAHAPDGSGSAKPLGSVVGVP